MNKNWRANQTNDMFYPFCIIRSRKPCKTQRTGFPLFLPFSKSSEMPVQSYLRILQGISTQNEFLRFVPFLPFSKTSETPVQSYLRILQGISARNKFLWFVPLLPFLKSSETPVRPYYILFWWWVRGGCASVRSGSFLTKKAELSFGKGGSQCRNPSKLSIKKYE